MPVTSVDWLVLAYIAAVMAVLAAAGWLEERLEKRKKGKRTP